MNSGRLALATRTMKARRAGKCPVCSGAILTGQQIARLTRPHGWCHVRCVPVVAAAIARITTAKEESLS